MIKNNREFFINLSLVVISILFTILGAEVFLRFTSYKCLLSIGKVIERYQYYKPDTITKYDILENVPKTFHDIGDIRYEIWSNELGCFDESYQGEQDYILLVGDSFTQAYAPFKDKWGTLLQEYLGYRVLKCGVSGYGTAQEFIKAVRIISKINKSPKLVVIGYAMNDLEDDYISPKTRVIVQEYLSKLKNMGSQAVLPPIEDQIKDTGESEKNLNLTQPSAFTKITQRIKVLLNGHSILFWISKSFMRDLFSKNQWFLDYMLNQKSWFGYLSFYSISHYPWLDQVWKDHLEDFKAFKELVHYIDANFLVVIIPAREQVYPLFGQKMQVVKPEQPNDILHDFFKKEGISYLDLLPDFNTYADRRSKKMDQQRDFYWSLDGHWNIRGNHLAGLITAQYIMENDLIDISDKEKRLDIVKEKINSLAKEIRK